MDFDLSKENIQPLRRGRNVQQLEMALQAQTNPEYQMQLLQQKEEFETLIRTYEGDDPLGNYYDYITWIEQSYPKNGHEGNCAALLEHCLGTFENDSRYTNDIRLCKLWIKYIDMFPNPVELYLMMKSKNLCTGCADFYKAWAYYYEAAGDFQRANNVFEEGKKNLAQPYDELEIAHNNLITAAGEHMLFGPNENRLQEKRQALTSLHSYRHGRVNNVRVPSGPSNGITSLPGAFREGPNVQLHVYEDEASASLMGGAAPRSIITVAKRQEAPKENTIKPGPWTTVPNKKRVLASHRPTGLGFAVHEDDVNDIPIGYLPMNLPPVCLENYSSWHVSIINCPEEESPKLLFGYPKMRVYSDIPQTEYSIEELRATRYRRNVSAVEQVETCEAIQSILVDDDDDDDCIVVVQDPPPMDSCEQGNFQIYQTSPVRQPQHVANNSVHQPYNPDTTSTISHSPWKSQAEHQSFLQDVFSKNNEHRLSGSMQVPKFEVLEDPEVEKPSPFVLGFTPSPKQKTGGFAVYEQSMQEIPPQAPPKGNAMKTAFRTLNADEVETGSRGGMEGAMAAQPADGAKPMAPIPFSDSSSSSIDDGEMIAPLESSCTTQQFNFNLNAMQVSTPQNKNQIMHMASDYDLQNSRKVLFSENKLQDKALSTILEEKSCYVSSSSCSASSGATTKSSLYSHHNKMNTISEEHNSYLEQNMKANEALRRSLLGDFMEDVLPTHTPPVFPTPPSPMQSTPVQSPIRKVMHPSVTQPLDYVPSDPFHANLISKLLDRLSFPGVHSNGFIQMDGNPRMIVKKEPVHIGRDQYIIEKVLGKGQFGTVFRAYNYQMSCTVALKYQKPPNKWEFYICRELQARLADHPLRDRFMDISVGYFSDQASVLVSQFEPFGSLLDTANLLKKLSTGKETVCIYFTLEMLKIVRAMHEVKIIHADIKPDNFLVLLLPDNTLGLQLIDFGCSIDMTLFPDNAVFTRPISTEDFICCEVRDGRPWSYHTDLFCVAASAHVLLFQDYIQLRKVRDNWSISSRLPRYTKHELWNMLFSNLLNQQRGPADVATIELLFQEELDEPPRQRDLPLQLNSLINMLKNR